jgi:hypothetical protein
MATLKIFLNVYNLFCLGELSPIFPEANIGLQKLCHGDLNRQIKIEVWDFQNSGKHNYISEGFFSINDVLSGKTKEIFLKTSKNKEGGSAFILKADFEDQPDFIDFLRGGCQLSLDVAIDFTGD